ncbi:MAG: molybdopterin-dependent oxidoreductase [Desulfobacterales bacterium]|nr:molybdopterin-dependent oxidoreductase [Desulfobacterales bacterium]MCF8079298.1 molybdopterin-dependent oxidoreductase [Desulfobacterales bacterium]
MPTRRQFIKWLTAAAGLTLAGWTRVRMALAEIAKKILPPGTDPGSLFHENPEYLDTRNLKVMPVNRFGTMGDTDQQIDPGTWRLEVDGKVARPLSLTLEKVHGLPAVERSVLLICPGFFSNHGTWQGVSLAALLKEAGVLPGADRLRIYGKSPFRDKKEVFAREEAETDAVFLAYAVNGRPLPVEHGFPLRVVAEGHWGAEWVKYVYRVEVLG